MNKILVSVISVVILLSSFAIDARQGCCSHHGGVCGCQCCDGTSLSAKCAPYYDCGDKKETTNKPKKSKPSRARITPVKTE